MAYVDVGLNFRYNFRFKNAPEPQNGDHFENFQIINTASIWHQKWKDHPKLCKKKYFQDDDVIDDVTGRPQSRSSIFLYEWNNNIFRDNCRTNKDNIFKVSAHMYNWIVNAPLQTFVDCSADDVIGFSNKSKLWTAIPVALPVINLVATSKSIFDACDVTDSITMGLLNTALNIHIVIILIDVILRKQQKIRKNDKK